MLLSVIPHGIINTHLCFVSEKKECGVCPIHHHCVQGECVCIPGFICQGEETFIPLKFQCAKVNSHDVPLYKFPLFYKGIQS